MDIKYPLSKRPASPAIEPSPSTRQRTMSTDLKTIASTIDRATEDEHKKMDNDVLNTFELHVRMQEAPKLPVLLLFLLLIDDRLINMETGEAEALLEKQPALNGLLLNAWEKGSFKEVRRLEILWPSQKPKMTSVSKEVASQRKAAYNAWEGPYVSGAEILLLNTIRTMKKARVGNWKPYSNFFPIIQSSGTGKSRAVHELARHIFTLPFNLRAESDNEVFAYPPPDSKVRDYFTYKLIKDDSFEAYLSAYTLFFAHLFDQVRDIVKRFRKMNTYKDLATEWRTYLDQGTNRRDLYNSVSVVAIADHDSEMGNSEHVNMKGKTAARLLLTALGELVLEPASDDVRMILYFDEAHTLSGLSALGRPGTFYDTLISAIDVYSEFDLFAITLSTKVNLSKFSPSQKYHHSSRIVGAEDTMQVPFTELQFDCLEGGKPLIRPNEKTLAEVSKVDFMIKFGRPLFWTRWKAANSYDLRFVRDNMVLFARSKLVGKLRPVDKGGLDECAKLAIFSTRLVLDFDPRREAATLKEAKLVESNMRIAYSVPTHREYLRSGTPSEPILAEAAALEMHALGKNIADVLIEIIEGGLISKGSMGELTARTMFIMAYDAAVKKKCESQSIPLTISIPVHLFEFLEELFGATHLKNILEVRADNDAKAGTFQDVFKNAYVRFTHFAVDGFKNKVSSHTAFAAIVRGMAIQCSPCQDLIDIMIPVVFLDHPDDKLCEQMISAILVRVGHRKASATLTIDEAALGRGAGFFPSGRAGNMKNGSKRPYITLVMQFGVQTKASLDAMHVHPTPKLHPTPSKLTTGGTSKRPSRMSTDHPRYAIFVSGCSDSVYNVVHDKNKFAQLLGGRDLLNEHPRQDEDSVAAVRRMKPFWEPGPECYDWIEDPVLNTAIPVEATKGKILLGAEAVEAAELGDAWTGFNDEDDPDSMVMT